jgi:GDP-L-fucose synthase
MSEHLRPDSRIYVAGHRGLVGSAIERRLRGAGFTNVITRTHAELDLTDADKVAAFLQAERPEYVFLAAAKVGGILANNELPAEFIFQNLAIETNVIHGCWRADVKRLLFLGSSCIYPRECPQPIREEYLLTGPLEPTNRPYAVAKIAGIEMCWAYNRQYGTRYLAAMPTNLYGIGDNFDLNTSHVLPALIRKMHEAKQARQSEVVVWGSGEPRREFLFSDDLANACIALMSLNDDRIAQLTDPSVLPLVNIGAGQDITIRQLAELVRKIVGFPGDLRFDRSKPDGTPRKLLDVNRLNALGWHATTSLHAGIEQVYQWYRTQAGG